MKAGCARFTDDAVFFITALMRVNKQRLSLRVEEIRIAVFPHFGTERPECRKPFLHRRGCREVAQPVEQQHEGEFGIGIPDAAFRRDSAGERIPEARKIAVVGKMTRLAINSPAKRVRVAQGRLSGGSAPHVCDGQPGRHGVAGHQLFERAGVSGTRLPVYVRIPILCEDDAPTIPVGVPLPAMGREFGQLVSQPCRAVA